MCYGNKQPADFPVMPASNPDPSPSGADGKRPTLRQVAEKLGVSAMTVSRALRDSPRVAPVLKKRIRALAERMGYRPDPEVAKLMNHLRRRDKTTLHASLAAITSIPETFNPSQLRRVFGSARARAAELGYRLELFRVEEPAKPNRRLERMLVNRGIEGVMALQMSEPVEICRLLDWGKFSAVLASPSVLAPDFPRVEAHYFHNARLLCARLAKLGFRRPGFTGSKTFSVRTNDAFPSAISWLIAGAGGGAPPRVLVTDTLHEAGEKYADWVAAERPDVVVAHSENVLAILREAMARRPESARPLVCTSVDPQAAACAGIDERNELIGRAAVDVLTGMLNRYEKNQRGTHIGAHIEGVWCEPATVKA